MQTYTTLVICVDNRAAIHMISNPGRRSGQHIVHRIVSLVDGLQQKEFTVELHGLPAHIEIRGNEAAERAAKEATKWRLRKIRWGRSKHRKNRAGSRIREAACLCQQKNELSRTK